MRRFAVLLLTGAALFCLMTSSAFAKKQSIQNIEFATVTCGEFMSDIQSASDEDVGVVLMWLDGYLSGVSGDTYLDWNNLADFGENLVTFCAQNASVTVLDAAKRVGIQ